jgi:hypothetical protein
MPVRTFVRRTLPLTGDNGRLLKNVLSSASGAVDKVAYYIPPRDATAFLRKASSRCLGCVGRIARGWARKANCEPERNRGIVIDTGRRSRRAGWRRPGRDPPAGIGDRAPERRAARDDHRGGIDACPVHLARRSGDITGLYVTCPPSGGSMICVRRADGQILR